jgi:hypothetical protein
VELSAETQRLLAGVLHALGDGVFDTLRFEQPSADPVGVAPVGDEVLGALFLQNGSRYDFELGALVALNRADIDRERPSPPISREVNLVEIPPLVTQSPVSRASYPFCVLRAGPAARPCGVLVSPDHARGHAHAPPRPTRRSLSERAPRASRRCHYTSTLQNYSSRWDKKKSMA